MQGMACMYGQLNDSDRCITPIMSGITIDERSCYGYHYPVANGGYHRDVDESLMESYYYSRAPYHYIDMTSPHFCFSNAKMRKTKEDKVCGVCGDKALSYNFDAITCESCKAFFRRNAPKGLDYFKCPYEERCRMDVSNRRFCKKCRLKKCFEIGMRKEYILTEEEKALKRKKIEENRNLRELSPHGSQPSSTEPVTRTQPPDQPAVPNEVTSQTVALSTEDAITIDELVTAYRNSLEITTDKDLSREEASFSDLVNIAELSVRRVIAMTKQVGAFKMLPQADQIQLLKGGSIELLILRSVVTFDKEKQHFLDPSDNEQTRAMKLEQLQKAENGTGLFDDHIKFVKSLACDLKADETTMILLLMISLFSPDRENLIYKDLVSKEQERYSLLLKYYLDSHYPASTARKLFPKLIMKLTDIRNLSEVHSQVLLRLNPGDIQPLMKEVLDLSR